MSDLIAYATPVFIALLLLEYVVGPAPARRRVRRGTRPATRWASLAMGLGNVVVRRGDEGRRARGLLRRLRRCACSTIGTGLGLAAALLRRGLLLLLVPPRPPRGALVLGRARQPPLEPALQPLDGAAPVVDDADHRPALLGAARAARLPPAMILTAHGDQPDLPVLDPHRADRPRSARSRRSSTRRRTTACTTARTSSYLDRNHAGILIVWDRLFGTFEPERERRCLRPDEEHRDLQPAARSPSTSGSAMFRDVLAARIAGATRSATCLRPPGWSPDGSTHTARQLQRQRA